MEKKCKKAKWLSEEALQIAVKCREAKSKGEKEKYSDLNVEFQRIARRDKKPFLSDQCKETEGNNEMGNRFKGLDLIDRVPDELWMEVCDIVQETGIKKNKCKKAKWLSEEALQIVVKRREGKSKGEKERLCMNAEF